MTVPNWQHNSGKDQKRKLKPQALRQAKKRAKSLINKLNIKSSTHKKGCFFINTLKSI
jgi:hypothetical protein